MRVRLRSAPCRPGRTSPALVTRRAPRDSRTWGLETSGRWIPLALLLGLDPLARQAVFLGGEKKLPLDLVGPTPLSSRGCLMPPSHFLSDGLASRWPGNYGLLESRARDHKVAEFLELRAEGGRSRAAGLTGPGRSLNELRQMLATRILLRARAPPSPQPPAPLTCRMQGKASRALGPRGGAAQGNLKTVGGWGEGEYVGTKIRARSVQP